MVGCFVLKDRLQPDVRQKDDVTTSIGSDFTVVTKDSQLLKTFGFQRLKRVPWVLFQGIVLGSS